MLQISNRRTELRIERRAAESSEQRETRLARRHVADRARFAAIRSGVLVRRVGSACWFGVLVRRVGSACWFGVLERRVGPPSATGSGVLVLPARQGAACCPPSATGSCVLCVGPPSATGSLVLPARQGAACWSSQRDRELCVEACWYSQRDRVCRQGLQPECRVPRT